LASRDVARIRRNPFMVRWDAASVSESRVCQSMHESAAIETGGDLHLPTMVPGWVSWHIAFYTDYCMDMHEWLARSGVGMGDVLLRRR